MCGSPPTVLLERARIEILNAGGGDVPWFVCADMGVGVIHWDDLVRGLGFIEAIVVAAPFRL